MDKNSRKIIAFGDSTTAEAENVRVYTEILKEKLTQGNICAKVLNKGIKLNTSADAAARLYEDVISEKPYLTIVQFGINDSAIDVWKEPPATSPRVPLIEYEKNIRHILRQLQAAGSKIILLSPNPLHWTDILRKMYGKEPYNIKDADGLNMLLKDYAAASINIAKQLDIAHIDIYSIYKSTGKWHSDEYLSDGIHPGEAGHRLVADMLWPILCDMLLDYDSTATGRERANSFRL